MEKYKVKILVVVFISLLLAFFACDKDDDNDKNNGEKVPLVFESLVAENDTIVSGEAVTITATATGKEIKYQWSANTGSIIGSGYQVNLATTPCVPEEITVTCTVKDAYNQSETKSVKIVTF